MREVHWKLRSVYRASPAYCDPVSQQQFGSGFRVFGEMGDDESLAVVASIANVLTDSSDRPNEEIKVIKGAVIESAA